MDINNSKEHKLINFNINHHEKLISSKIDKDKWWENEISNGKRCSTCWLRPHECYCYHLKNKKNVYNDMFSNTSKTNNDTNKNTNNNTNKCIKIYIHYHYQEIGRGPNTGHVLEALLPNEMVEKGIYGDINCDKQLINDMINESDNDDQYTCILYPDKTSVLLSQWIKTRPRNDANKPIRVIVLDGTYAQASRQWKYLSMSMQKYHKKLPLVKLDIEEGGMKSAIAGIMYQPGKEKICTYQACVMAMREAGISATICNSFDDDLELWLVHLLKTSIKKGKSKQRKVEGVDYNPAPNIKEVIENSKIKRDHWLLSKHFLHKPAWFYNNVLSERVFKQQVLRANSSKFSIALVKTKKFFIFCKI